jgi:hypothetical protein
VKRYLGKAEYKKALSSKITNKHGDYVNRSPGEALHSFTRRKSQLLALIGRLFSKGY